MPTVLIRSALVLAVLALGAGGLAWWQLRPGAGGAAPGDMLRDAPFDGAAAYGYLKALCGLGPRPSGSVGMTRQQELLEKHFRDLGAQVARQEFFARHPLTAQQVKMTNLLVHWHPDRRERILLCAHYDTRPYPDRDRRNPQGVFLGANDGASGVALLMELGKSMPKYAGRYGVDFVFFDGEELVFRETDPYFLGSEHFAAVYARDPPPYRYVWGVLLDMVADKDLQIYYERNSLRTPAQRELAQSIWRTAQRLGIREFIPRTRHEVRDDHLPLNNVARIPTVDIIDFDYPYWHTQLDVPEQCSAESLTKVGSVLWEWLQAPP
jgi:glutaminyl-peptide cyclotransferase